MDTTSQTSPEVKPAIISEAEALAFYMTKNAEIRERHGKLCSALGFDSPSLSINHYGKPFEVCSWKSATYFSGKGHTIAEAEAEFAAKIKDRMPQAAKLREDAAKLIAEAEKLEAATAGKEGA